MKINYIVSFLGIGLLVSCEPRLDLTPVGTRSTATYYQTVQDADAAVAGAYSTLLNIYSLENLVTPNTVAADDGVPFLSGNADRRALWSYNLVSTNSLTQSVWTNAYQGIQRCNVAVNRLPGIAMDETLKKRYLGEVKFIRALMYFNLVRYFGGLPLVTTETNSLEDISVPRSSVDEVYTLIQSDLLEAESVLPKNYTGADVGRATLGAAKGLLAKVYLTRAGATASSPFWAQAAAKAKEVIDLSSYDLWANYADAYDMKNKSGKESVFEITYLTDILGNWHTTYWAPRNDPRVPSGGFGTIRPTQSLWNLYSDQDKRRDATFLTSYVNPTTNKTVSLTIDTTDPALAISFWKLADLTSKLGGGGGKSFPVLRFSDILLMYAEALSEANGGPTTEAYAAVNRVRARAGLAPLSGLSQARFKDAVLLERRLEFCLEGQRWFDLVRTGRLLDAVKAETSFGRAPQIQPYNVVFPIPQREIDANPALKQNQGY